jgi:hypothetical protein
MLEANSSTLACARRFLNKLTKLCSVASVQYQACTTARRKCRKRNRYFPAREHLCGGSIGEKKVAIAVHHENIAGKGIERGIQETRGLFFAK